MKKNETELIMLYNSRISLMRLLRSTLVIFLFLGLAMAADAQSGASTNISLSFTGTASGNVETGISGSGSGRLLLSELLRLRSAAEGRRLSTLPSPLR